MKQYATSRTRISGLIFETRTTGNTIFTAVKGYMSAASVYDDYTMKTEPFKQRGGGMGCGFVSAGFETVAALDMDPYAAITYMVNLGAYPCKFHCVTKEDEERLIKAFDTCAKSKKLKPLHENFGFQSGCGWIKNQVGVKGCKHFFIGDIRKLKGRDILDRVGLKPGEVTVVTGGPPCQGFSRAGRRDVMDPRNSLVFEFARMIIEIEPIYFVMENVPDMVTMVTPEGIPVTDAFCALLSDGGYGAYDSLKKALVNFPDSKAVAKGKCTIQKTDASEMDNTQAQMNLFDGEAA